MIPTEKRIAKPLANSKVHSKRLPEQMAHSEMSLHNAESGLLLLTLLYYHLCELSLSHAGLGLVDLALKL